MLKKHKEAWLWQKGVCVWTAWDTTLCQGQGNHQRKSHFSCNTKQPSTYHKRFICQFIDTDCSSVNITQVCSFITATAIKGRANQKMKNIILLTGCNCLNFCEVHLEPEKAHLNMKTWLFDSENMKMQHACLTARMKSDR